MHTQRIRRPLSWVWQQRYRFPLTALGAAVTAISLWLFWGYGVEQQDVVVRAAAAVVLLLLLAAMTFVGLVTLLLWLRLRLGRGDRLDPLELECGVETLSGFSFPRFTVWPLVQLRLEWASPSGVEVSLERTLTRIVEVVRPTERGDHRSVQRRFIVADIFGLCRLGVVQRATQRVRVLPGAARANALLIRHIAGGDTISDPQGPAEGELLDMRRYAHGDPLRMVLWRAYARTRQLLVRTTERAISPSPSAMAYFVAGPEDEPSASIARLFLQQGWLGEGFLFQADGADEATGDRDEALTQLIRSRHARQHGAQGLQRFFERARSGSRVRRSCLLFLPAAPGPWLAELARLRSYLSQTIAIVAVDSVVLPHQTSALRRLLFFEPSEMQGENLSPLLNSLVPLGLDLRILHRPSGEAVPLAALRLEGPA